MKKICTIIKIAILLVSIGLSYARGQTFVHPGIPFTQYDLDQLKANITKEPWLTGYNALRGDSRSKLDYSMRGPFATVSRAPNLNNDAWKSDMIAIHHLAFMWVFTGDNAFAKKATGILDAWAVTNTTWDGNENMLDIGDLAPYFVTGADILKSTYPGWTAQNTAHVRAYFEKVIYPTSWVPGPLRDCNKGAIQLQIALSVAAFLDDPVKFNQAIEVYRMDAGGGLRNSLPNGEVGDSGRDDHWFGQIFALAWGAEVAWKQGVDMFAEFDNRLKSIGELYNQYSIAPNTVGPFIPYGGYSVYWTNWGIPPGFRHQHPFNNIIEGAYAVRKNIPTPYTTQMRALVGEGAWSFLYLKSSDTTKATPLNPIVYPAELAQPVSHLTNIDIGNTGIAGSAAYNNGIWTAKGAGNNVASVSNYTFKPVKGDVGIIVKVESNSISSATSGLMIRESLAANSRYVSVNLHNGNMSSSAAGQNVQTAYSHYLPKAPWWLKLERVGNRLFTYHSQDGIHWTNNALYIISSLPANAYIGLYTVSNNISALNTATFSNVSINNTAPEGSPVISSATAVSTTIGTAFNYAVTASDNPTIYRAAGLPAGLSIDTLSGEISGTPTALEKAVVSLEAVNTHGAGTATLVISVTNNTAPVEPAGVTAGISNTTRISISWPAVANSTSYSVKRSFSETGPFTVLQSGITGTSFIDAKPEPEVNNYYVVTALAGELESGNSNVVFASVPPEIPSKPVVINKNNQIDLSWEAASGAVTYNVKRGTVSGGPYTIVDTVSTTNYSDTNVINGDPYYYVVSSLGNTKESGNSAEAFGVPGASSVTWSPTPTTDSLNLASNWVENTLPVNPAIITFNASADTILTNDITGLEVSRMQFDREANTYTIGGNNLVLKNDLVNNSTNRQTLRMPLVLNSQLNVNTDTDDIHLSGGISGTGNLLKTGDGIFYITGANTYSGNTIINGKRGGWPPVNAIAIAGHGTGTPGAPTSGPLGTGKIIMNGGSLFSSGGDATLYNDIEITAGKRSYMYETTHALILRGRLIGSGTLEHDGNTYAGFHLYGDNSEFTGTFISKLRSGNQRIRFHIPQSGSAKAHWLLDANGVDCQGIQFPTGTLHFGGLSGRGFLRNNAKGSPVISIGALNTNSKFDGTFQNFLNVEKVGTGTLTFTGNHNYGGATTIKKGKFLLNNNPSSGTFISPVIAEAGAFGGIGVSTAPVTIGTGSGAGATFVPGDHGVAATFTTSAAVTFKGPATYAAEINSTSVVSDKIAAGSVTMGNTTLTLTDLNSGTLPLGTVLTIIDNRGTAAVNGAFNGLPEGALIEVGANVYQLSYSGGTGNDVALTVTTGNPVPAITSSYTFKSDQGSEYHYEILAVNLATNYNAIGLPEGLNINTHTGEISGIPTVAGVFPVELSATNANGTGTATLTLTILTNVVPEAPKDVETASVSSTGIDLSWLPAATATSYTVKRSQTDGGTYVTVAANITGNSYSDTGLAHHTTYYYVVSATNHIGEGANSEEVSETTQIPGFPTTPLGVTATAAETTIYLNWMASSEASNYDIKRAPAGSGPYTVVGHTASTSFTDTNLTAATTYYYTVSATNITGESENSAVVSATTVAGLNPYSYWPFDEGAGTTSADVWNGRNATLGTGATWTSGITGHGVKLNGNTRVTLPSGIVSTLTDFTISSWVKLATTSNWVRLFDFGTGTNNYMFVTTRHGAAGNGVRFAIRTPSAGEQIINGPGITTGKWIHITVTRSGNLGILYINGVEAGRNGNITLAPSSLGNTTQNYIGDSQWPDPKLNGIVDDFRIYSRALSTPEIAQMIAKKGQHITFSDLPDKKIGDADFEPGAIASSGLPVVYISSSTSVATIVNNKIHIMGSGVADITASQGGDDVYNATSPVTRQLSVFVPPLVKAKDIQVLLDNSSRALITPEQVNDSSVSYNGDLILSIDRSTFDCSDAGKAVTVTLTGTDARGYTGSATSQVTVVDNLSAVPITPGDQFLCYRDTESYTVPYLQIADNCGIASVSYSVSGTTTRTGSGPDASGIFNTGESIIHWTVADLHGNVAEASVTVVVNEPLSATIPDVYVLDPAVCEKNTIYNGYGPSSLTITALARGGMAPYTYLWDNGDKSQSLSVSMPGTYNVAITDFKGCTTTASIKIETIDVRCGHNNDKVLICHNGKTICISSADVQDHLNHGDQLGTCRGSFGSRENLHLAKVQNRLQDVDEENENNMIIYPNPAEGLLNIRLNKLENAATVDVYNTSGVVVLTERLNSASKTLSLKALAPGVYYVKVKNGQTITSQKIVKL